MQLAVWGGGLAAGVRSAGGARPLRLAAGYAHAVAVAAQSRPGLPGLEPERSRVESTRAQPSAGQHVLVGWGINTSGQLGFPSSRPLLQQWTALPWPASAQPANAPDPILDVGCGRSHTMILTAEGLFGLGSNVLGQCGGGKSRRTMVPQDGSVSLRNLPQPVAVACGYDHTLLRCSDGTLLSSGWAADGQLGLGSASDCYTFSVISGLPKVAHVSTFADTALAVTEDGSLYGWGNNEYGQLSTASTADRVNQPTQIPTPCDEPVKYAASGATASLAILRDGRAFVTGAAADARNNSWRPVAPHMQFQQAWVGGHALALLDVHGQLYTWGVSSMNAHGHGQGVEVIPEPRPLVFSDGVAVDALALGHDFATVALNQSGGEALR